MDDSRLLLLHFLMIKCRSRAVKQDQQKLGRVNDACTVAYEATVRLGSDNGDIMEKRKNEIMLFIRPKGFSSIESV